MNDCCLLVSQTLPVSLKRTLVGGRRFRPNFWTSGIDCFGTRTHRISRSKSGLCCRVRTIIPFTSMLYYYRTRSPRPFVVVDCNQFLHSKEAKHRSRKVQRSRADKRISRSVTMSRIFVTAFSVVACCVLLRNCSFLSHPSHGSGTVGLASLVHIEFCVETLRLGTVSVCLAWSPPLPRYRCCVDCLYCDLDT